MPESQPSEDLKHSLERAHATRVEEPVDAYFEAARGAFSRNTERALRSDVQVFRAWCREQVRTAFPASAATVAAFVDEMGRIKTPATVRRCVSSIATVHKALQETNPVDSTAVRFALQRMHRRRGRRQAQVQGLTWPLRNLLIEATGDRLIDARDRALLAVGYDTLLRRAELVSVKVADVLEEIDGTATLLVRWGKTDGEGRGATLYLARDTVALVKTWREVGSIDGGYLFRSVRKDATVGEKLDASQVPRIYKRMARHAGIPADIVDTLAGHSTRVGAVQDMIACGIELPAILQSGRWKTTRMVQHYGERLLARRSGAAQLAERQNR